MFENKSLSTKSATPSSRILVSAKATPTVFVRALAGAPGAAGEDVTLIAITTGAEVMSAFPKSISSTSCKFPGDAYDYGLASSHSKPVTTHLFVQLELRSSFALPCFGNPYLYLQLTSGQSFSEERLRRVRAERDTWQPTTTAWAEILDHRVRMIHLGCNIERIWPMDRVVVPTVEEPDCACLWRLGWQPFEESTEPGMRGVVWDYVNI